MANKNLTAAKAAKNDEFYTRFEDICQELLHPSYCKAFYGKVIYLNCDDPEWSNFWRFFKVKFNELNLKGLYSTHYSQDGSPSYYLDYDGKEIHRIQLKGNGDFRSEECVELLKQADVVVTNPPFSLFREYVAQLMEYNKKFVIWSNNNSITYKEIFPLIKDNKMWLGYTANKTLCFRVPENYKYDEKITQKINDGHHYGKVPAISVFTNIDLDKRHEKMILQAEYDPDLYPKYDNYDAINVDRVADIPCDYDGVMGVPITFLDKYNPEQFEIVSFRKGEDGKDLVFTREREREFNHTFESWYEEYKSTGVWSDEQFKRYISEWEKQVCENRDKKIEPIDLVYPKSTAIAGMIKSGDGIIGNRITYGRILIKRKGE